MHKENSGRTTLNILSQWFNIICVIFINFFLISFVVKKVGVANYGGWTGIMSIIGYLNLLDAGLSVSLQHYISKYNTTGENFKLTSIFSSAYIIYAIGSVLAGIICLVVSIWYSSLFPKVPDIAAAQCSVALYWVAAGMVIYILNLPIQGSLMGLQKYPIRNIIEIIGLTAQAVFIVFIFKISSPSLVYMGAAFFLTICLRFILSFIALKRINPYLVFKKSFVSKESLKQVLSYSGHSAFWTLATVVVRDSGPLVSNAMLSSTASTYLFVASRLTTAIGSFMTSMGLVFIPLASSLKASNDITLIRKALIRGTRIGSVISMISAVILLIYGENIIKFWVGFNDITCYYVLIFMIVGRLGTWMFNVPMGMLMGLKSLWSLTILQGIVLITCLIFMPLFTYYYGVLGLVTGMLLATGILYLTWIPYSICRDVNISFWFFLKAVVPISIILSTLVGFAGVIVKYLYYPQNITTLIFEICLLLLFAMFLVLSFGLDSDSRHFLINKVKTLLLS
jgi:O-antigen/teichoic acid export membrane protein